MEEEPRRSGFTFALTIENNEAFCFHLDWWWRCLNTNEFLLKKKNKTGGSSRNILNNNNNDAPKLTEKTPNNSFCFELWKQIEESHSLAYWWIHHAVSLWTLWPHEWPFPAQPGHLCVCHCSSSLSPSNHLRVQTTNYSLVVNARLLFPHTFRHLRTFVHCRSSSRRPVQTWMISASFWSPLVFTNTPVSVEESTR